MLGYVCWVGCPYGVDLMARDNPKPTFRTIPIHADYPGLTGLQTGPTTELVALGLGPDVEAMLLAKAREIGRG